MRENRSWWQRTKSTFLGGLVKSTIAEDSLPSHDKINTPVEPLDMLAKLSQYFLLLGEPNLQLSPRWLADRLETTERELLDTMAYALRDGIVELRWEVFCSSCGGAAETFASLTHAKSQIDCLGCESMFELHLDRNVNVTFSASERFRRERGDEPVLMPSNSLEFAPTKGLDLLLIPSFHKLFSGETPSVNESLRIGYVTVLFTDLRGSTAMYAERGDTQAYKMVREHFDILTDEIERNRGVFIKTIGDSVMASFAKGADAINTVFESQSALRARTAEMGGELVLKAGIHAGACLAVNLNNSLDFFGTVVNTAARLEGLSHGNDVIVSDVVFEEAKKEITQFCTVEDIDAQLRGLADTVHIRRLSAC
ncbi:MAG: adenylate/guanylate cyclase domain-containing protein [Pyrinomonadaceae bacterium]